MQIRTILFSFLTLITFSTAFAQNGINVGEPKIYDRRALQEMLRALDERLRQLNTIEEGKLSVDRITGIRQRSFALSVQASTLPTPAISNTMGSKITNTDSLETTGSATTDKDGTSSTTGSKNTGSNSDETTSSQTITRASASPTIPPATPTAVASVGGPAFGLNAADILDSQVNLAYQIANLRLLLNGAISDQIRGEGDSRYRALQAVIGFQVSIDPGRACKNCLAEVAVVVASKPEKNENASPQPNVEDLNKQEGQAKPEREKRMSQQAQYLTFVTGSPKIVDKKVRLVTLIPKERSYNVSSVSTKDISIGGGAVVGIMNIGGTGFWSRKNVYLVKDFDTVALDFTKPSSNEANFGWHFRPVLGRKIVDPGIRQVFAVLSIPMVDAGDKVWNGNVTVTTRWRNITDPTSSSPSTSITNSVVHFSVSVTSTEIIDSQLGPVINRAFLEQTDGKNAVLTVEGKQFGNDTQVQVGNLLLTDTRGMYLDSDTKLRVAIPVADLARAKPVVTGTYGKPVPILIDPLCVLQRDKSLCKDQSWGLTVAEASVTSDDKDSVKVTLKLKSKDKTNEPNLHDLKPLVVAGSEVYGPGGRPLLDRGTQSNASVFEFIAPLKELRAQQELMVRLPLWGDDYVARTNLDIPKDFLADNPVLISTVGALTYAISGKGFEKDQMQLSPCGTLDFKASTLLIVKISPSEKPKQIILSKTGAEGRQILKLPPVPPAAPRIAKQDDVFVGTVKSITLAGEGLGQIYAVEFEHKRLNIDPASVDSGLIISLISEVTHKEGEKELTLLSSTGETFRYVLIVKKQ